MNMPELLYNDFHVERTLGEVPRIMFRATVKDNNPSEGIERWLHINRISFAVELHAAKDWGSSYQVGRLGEFDSSTPITLLQGHSSYVYFSIPLNSTIIETMLKIRDKDEHVAFRISLTIAAIYYHKQQEELIISDILQSQCVLWENMREGKMPLILIPADELTQFLKSIQYTEIMKFEIPLYGNTSPINEPLRKTITLLKNAAMHLEQGQNEGALVDIRMALTNYLLANKGTQNERILDTSLSNDWISKSPTDVIEIYKDILLRMQEGLRAALKITDKFLHDDNTLKMPPLRKDVEFVYFNVAHTVARLIDNHRS
jgi:hypothetical protein